MAAKRSQEMRVFLAAILRSKTLRAVRAAVCVRQLSQGVAPDQLDKLRVWGLTFLTWMRGLPVVPSSWFHLEGETE